MGIVRAGCALLIACAASAAGARTPELPRELRGRLRLEVRDCRVVGENADLLEARIALRAGATEVSLPGLHCAAFDARGEPYYLAPVSGALRLPAGSARELSVRMAADARHRECGCTVRDVRNFEREELEPAFAPEGPQTGDVAFDTLVADLSRADADVAAGPLAADPPPYAVEPAAMAKPGLRFERVLAPALDLRAQPSERAAGTGALPPGARVAVDRIERGWKLVRSADGRAGWIPGDAATADIGAPERMAERLAPLRAMLAPGASASEALCSSLPRDQLGDLVALWRIEQRSVYLRPLWYTLAPEDRDAFQAYALDCYGVTRLFDATRGIEIRSADWEGAPGAR